jgi:hypothetical protein
MKLLIKFPTRERRQKFYQAMDLLLSNKKTNNVSFLITLDADDETMNNDEVKHQIEFYSDFYDVDIEVNYGYSMNKIHACNRDLEEYKKEWDIVMLMSDDMYPVMLGYDEKIINLYENSIPDTDGVLYSPDGYTPLNTLCILGKKYYQRFNYIYYPEYISFFPDNEFMEVSQILGKEFRINKVLFKHEHPANDSKVKFDELYQRNNISWEKDKILYYQRRARNFDL